MTQTFQLRKSHSLIEDFAVLLLADTNNRDLTNRADYTTADIVGHVNAIIVMMHNDYGQWKVNVLCFFQVSSTDFSVG